MVAYISRRLLAAIPTLLAISVVLFGILHLAPGGPLAVYSVGLDADPEQIAAIEERLGLNDPLPLQYGRWLIGIATGDWGHSYKYARDVSGVIRDRVWPSLELMSAALLIALVASVPLGVTSALSPRRSVQSAASIASMLGISMPTFWLGLMILLLFSVRLRLLPSGGIGTVGQGFDPVD